MLLPSQTLSSLTYALSAFIIYFTSYFIYFSDRFRETALFDQNANSFATKWKREINCCVGCVLVLVFVKGLRCLITLCYVDRSSITLHSILDDQSGFLSECQLSMILFLRFEIIMREGRVEAFLQAIFSVFFKILA